MQRPFPQLSLANLGNARRCVRRGNGQALSAFHRQFQTRESRAKLSSCSGSKTGAYELRLCSRQLPSAFWADPFPSPAAGLPLRFQPSRIFGQPPLRAQAARDWSQARCSCGTHLPDVCRALLWHGSPLRGSSAHEGRMAGRADITSSVSFIHCHDRGPP